ncbi:MAG: purine-nucleoside phosphorylase [Elusimicrobia bacterium]|nr:purine-nucleoside phosphorylase [Elusimicrobiota bacterium]
METKKYLAVVRGAARYMRGRLGGSPRIAVVLGSGLARAVPPLERSRTIAYGDIPGFPRATVAGHAGKLICGRLGGACVAVMQGRFHYYEGHSFESIALPLRALRSLGVDTLLLTAAVGSVRENIKPGHFVAIKDHINFMGRNPLRGFHQKEFGPMFPDLIDAYDPRLRGHIASICRRRGLPCREGVYTAVCGPSYETPAEIRAFRAWGGDVVGMSVVPEVIAARQMGMRVAALAWVSNLCAGMKGAALDHAEVLALGERVADGLRLVLADLIQAA